MIMQNAAQYHGADRNDKAFREVWLIDALGMTLLINNCFRQVRAWATIHPVLQSTSLSTPQTVLELANMLRDPIGNLRCPFGSDFEEQCRTGNRMDCSHRIPCWLALVELYSDGYRYGCHSDTHLPYVFEQVVDVLLAKRRERYQGAPEQLFGV